MAESVKKTDNALAIDPAQALQFAVNNPTVPKTYTNHFGIVVGVHDVTLMLGQSGLVGGVVYMSYPLAKALGKELTAAVAGYEKSINALIPDVVTLEEMLKPKANPT